ncbi:conserved hypothetical protein [Gloeothece citriformis PCC 7424]|uniref:Plastid lipid-associated protein/fibrillin conserved domain-containing protein n=1 Tax=Gloeothece citriformis (strain PCC 7424) TaxID=65393 RepID=B7KID2_GLOC7|nr:hypothetical protein [Gloeothece citriformis]ACK73619.1 conserved hypothetical protein [Gloeothece citriformis PCC 7424]
MIETSSVLEQVVNSVIVETGEKPSPEKVVDLLLQSEKLSKKSKERDKFEQLAGNWRLCFITGTRKVRNRAGIILGSGRYLPSWVRIYLSYSDITDTTGNIENSVELGLIKFSLSGPTKFLPQKNILVFDFTRMSIKLFGVKLYDGFIRGGQKSEDKFYQEKINQQAFFTYFLIRDNLIAARGRGGGLALWGREIKS